MSTSAPAFDDTTWSPRESALVIIDLTRDAARGGPFETALADRGVDANYYFDRIDQVVTPNVTRLLASYRQSGVPVAFTRLRVDFEDARDWPPAYRQELVALGLAPCSVDAPGSRFLGGLVATDDDVVVGKRTVSAFTGTDLAQRLRARGVRRVVLTGCTTNFGVGVSAIDAANQGFEVTLIDDACATLGAELHATWIDMHRMFFDVQATDSVLGNLQNGRSATQS